MVEPETLSCGCGSCGCGSSVASQQTGIREVLYRIAEILEEDRSRGSFESHDPSSDAVDEARWLVSSVLGLSLSELSVRMLAGTTIDESGLAAIDDALLKLRSGEPFAYAVGTAEFRHLTLRVDRRVLIPRPETEVVVEEVLRATAGAPGGLAIDIGTGSGAIALSLALEGHFDRIVATDISADALDVARENARRLSHEPCTMIRGTISSRRQFPNASDKPLAPVEFRQGADLAPVTGLRARVLVSNPPYIAYGEAASLSSSVRNWEPPVALFADNGGMARYEALISGVADVVEPGGWLVLELDSSRAARTADLALQAGLSEIRVVPDLFGRDRVLVARVRGGQ